MFQWRLDLEFIEKGLQRNTAVRQDRSKHFNGGSNEKV